MKSKQFKLNLSTESPVFSDPTIPQYFLRKLNNIKVTVVISSVHNTSDPQLIFNYTIEIPKTLQPLVSWKENTLKNYGFVDRLWEDTCLECFIGKVKTDEYIEINVSPQGANAGAYAVYHFSGYRTPNTIPPHPLLLNDIDNNGKQKAIVHVRIPDNTSQGNAQNACYQRIFTFKLSQLPDTLQSFNLISPSVIIFYDKHELFYAYQHASPPDFHKKSLWHII